MTGPPGKSRGWLCTPLRKRENHLRMLTWTVATGGAGEGFSSVQLLSRVQLFANTWTAARQASLSITNSQSLLKLMSIELVMLSNHVILMLSLSPFAFNPSQRQGLFQWIGSSNQVAKVLEFQLQHQSFQWICRNDFLYDGLVGSPCCPRDSEESSPTPQFKSINSLALNFHYGPILISVHDYWKNHSFDYMRYSSFKWFYPILFSQPATDWYLGCFQFLL